MSEITAIEWVDHTWSPWIGCTKVSEACDNCYAAAMARRYGWAAFETGAPRHRTSAGYWKQPHAWNRKARAAGRRAKVFSSLCDPFDSEVDPAWRADYMAEVEATPWLEWQVLTKRPKVAEAFFAGRAVPANVRLGITAETQKMLELRAPSILRIAAGLKPFVSAEPLLGPLDLKDFAFGWVIAGGESGPKARPSHPAWFRALRDQCVARSIPFFFKQWGEWAPAAGAADGDRMMRKGKKKAGARLDGRDWRETPR